MYAATLIALTLSAVSADPQAASVGEFCSPNTSASVCETGSSCEPLADGESGLCVPDRADVLERVAGRAHLCELRGDGSVACWDGDDRGLFAGDPTGGAELPLELFAFEVAAGDEHACALLEDGSLRCWGENPTGQLGLGHTADVSADQPGAVPLGFTAVRLAAHADQTCAISEDSTLRCWGDNSDGRLGYGTVGVIGDDETPAAVGDAPVDGVLDVLLFDDHVCVTTETGEDPCAGKNWNGKIRF